MILSCLALSVQAIGNISKTIAAHDADFTKLETTSVLSIHPTLAGSFETESLTGGSLVGGTLLDKRPKAPKTAGMATDDPNSSKLDEYLRFAIPREDDEDMVLRLYHAKIFSKGAEVCAGDYCKQASQGQHYWGIVEGRPDDSLASCSISDYETSCIIQLGDDQFELGNLLGTDLEILYNTKQLQVSPAVNLDDKIEVPDSKSKPSAKSMSAQQTG